MDLWPQSSSETMVALAKMVAATLQAAWARTPELSLSQTSDPQNLRDLNDFCLKSNI